MKNFWWIFIGIGVLILGFVFYRMFIPPKFVIENYDYLKKEGVFIFGGKENTFGVGKGGGVNGYMGWGLTYGSKDGQTTTFDLYKNGKFIKTIKTI